VFTKLVVPLALLVCTLAAPVAYVQLGHARAKPPAQHEWAIKSLPGAVVLAGGHFIDSMGEEFVRLAGGTKARLVLIPTAYGPTEEEGVEQFYELWGRFQPAKISVLHTRDRQTANDPNFVAPLREATGVWFLGGVQSRLTDIYSGTLLHDEVHRLVARGGAVGGNCAGAMALGETMIVGGDDDDEDDDAVVLRPGLGIIPKMVADSHVLERNRLERLRGVIVDHPDHFGVGIDSSTAVVIDHGQLRVVGSSYVTTIVPVEKPEGVHFDTWRQGSQVELDDLFAAR